VLDDLTEDELAALDEIPSDAVDHWNKGELWDSKTKTWKHHENESRKQLPAPE